MPVPSPTTTGKVDLMTKLKLSSIKADLNKEANGEMIPYKPWPGVSFMVRSTMCQTYQVARAQLYQRWSAAYGDEPVPPSVLSSDIGKLLCEHILIGWDGLDVEYSKEKALEVLCDEAFREVRAAVEFCASKVAAITPKFEADTAKN